MYRRRTPEVHELNNKLEREPEEQMMAHFQVGLTGRRLYRFGILQIAYENPEFSNAPATVTCIGCRYHSTVRTIRRR
jgi:hypothetical protein